MKDFYALIGILLCFNANSQIDTLLLAHEHYTLPNGLQVVLQPEESVKEVSVEFWLLDGTAIDEPHQYGLQHFFEHIMPYSPMDSDKRDKFFDDYLKGSNAQVKKDFSRFYLKVIPEGLELALERTSGRLKAGPDRISEKRVESERTRVLAEIKRNAKNPHWSAPGSLAIYEGTFGVGHPYAANGYGQLENNKRFTLNDLRQRYRDIVYANNVVLFIVGNFDLVKTKALILGYFGDLEAKRKTYTSPVLIKQSTEQVSAKAPHPQDSLNTLVLSWAISEWKMRDDAALRLISAHLNNSFGKEELTLTPSVQRSGAYSDMYANAGQFYIRIQFSDSKDSTQIEQFLLDKIKQLTDRKLEVLELQKALASEINDIKDMQNQLGFQWSRTELLGKNLLFHGKPNAYFKRVKLQQRMSARKIKKAAQTWLKNDPFRILFTARK